jgi:hypothetical protein
MVLALKNDEVFHMRSMIPVIIAALLMAAGLVWLGCSVQKGLTQFRMADRAVTVKGLAERAANADIAIWSLPLTATANDLAAAQANIDDASKKTIAFLKVQGFADAEIKIQKTDVTDLLAQEYRSNDANQSRYIIKQYILVETNNIDNVAKAQADIGNLYKQGVVTASGQSQVKYVFNGLNAIKPEMIAEATKNAREGAEQFARDSKATLGGIKTATQGQFQILPDDSEFQMDEAQSPKKKIRVVTTVEYYLQIPK